MPRWPEVLLDPATRLHWRITALAPVDSDFGFRERHLEHHLLWHVTDGRAEVRLAAGDGIGLRRGSLMWLPPQTVHDVWIPRGARPMFAYSFSFRVDCAGTDHGFDQPILRDHEPAVTPLLDELHADCALADRYSPLRSRAVLFTLFTRLQRGAQGHGGAGLDTTQRHALIRYLDRRLHLRPTPADLAQRVGLSPDYFARTFRRAFGISPKRWIVQQRIHRAALLLQQERLPVHAVAERLGYADANLFSRQFRSVMGRAPGSYRRG